MSASMPLLLFPLHPLLVLVCLLFFHFVSVLLLPLLEEAEAEVPLLPLLHLAVVVFLLVAESVVVLLLEEVAVARLLSLTLLL